MNQPRELTELVERSLKIGSDQSLVLYGGGNTSSKGELTDHLGRTRKVMWVKGSGADMMYGAAKDYPGLYLDDLIALADFDDLDDDVMTDYVTKALVDPGSRRPSIETLLHAFLPAKHIDHVHADAICALTNHADGKRAVKEALGDGFAYVDYIRPGFALSKMVAELKDFEGVILAHHGLVVWDENSDRVYAKNFEVIEKAEKYLNSLSQRPEAKFIHSEIPEEEYVSLLLQLRGKLGKKQLLTSDSRLKSVTSRNDLEKIAAGGAASADHMLRIRPKSAVIDLTNPDESIDKYRSEYQNYFERNKSLLPQGYASHGNDPKVLLVPGMGTVAAATTVSESAMLHDIAFHTHSVAARVADCFGTPITVSEAEIFRFDYWPMELYKLQFRPKPSAFAGSIFIVTGGGSGIGRGIALELGRLGAQVILADLDPAGIAATKDAFAQEKCQEPYAVVGDQSDASIVARTVRETVLNFGGLDGVVMNAGIGVSGTLEELSVDSWRKGLEINLTSAFLLTQEAMKVMRKQNLGGSLVYIASKNAFSPGAGFGGYSVSKAGMLQLMRIAALEGGSIGVRANAINPDAIFDNSKLWEGGIREQRAAAHGVAPEKLEDFYASRNMLNAHVRSVDVAKTTAFLLSEDSSRTTGAVIAVDGGVAAAFPR